MEEKEKYEKQTEGKILSMKKTREKEDKIKKEKRQAEKENEE